MNSRQLQYVVTLAEEKNFTKAAKRLIIAQPSLSQYISKLENELGHTLFDRTTTPLRLTVAGAVSYTHLDVYKRQSLYRENSKRHGSWQGNC